MARTEVWTPAQYAAYQATGQEPREPMADVSESDLLAYVRQTAKRYSWLFYHTHNSQRSEQGFPDCVLAKPGRLIFAELKSRTGKPTKEQAIWLDLLRHTGRCEVYVWYPSDLGLIETILREGPL